MTGPEIMAVVGFFVMIVGAGWRVWSRVEDKVKVAEGKADDASRDLAAHRLHVAETYVTKAGMSEQTAQIMKAIDSVGAKIDRTNERLDSLMQPRTRTPRN